MLVQEYLGGCRDNVIEALKTFDGLFTDTAVKAYAAYRWGLVPTESNDTTAAWLDTLTAITPDAFNTAKAVMDKQFDHFADEYGDAFTCNIVKERYSLVPGNPHMQSQQASFDGSDKNTDHSPNILYHLENVGTEIGQAMREAVLDNASDEAKLFFHNLDYDPVRLVDGADLSSKMWHEMRHYSIGMSELGCLTGNSPFNNSMGVWHSKLRHPVQIELSEREKAEKERIFSWGHQAESYLRELVPMHPEFGGCKVIVDPMVFGSVDKPWLTCNLDAILAWPDGHYSLLEFKAPSSYKRAEYEDNKVPAYYYDQIQGQMMLLNVDDAYLVALFDRDTFTVSHVYRDLDYQMDLAQLAELFWHNNILGNTPPELNGNSDTIIEMMNRYYGHSDSSKPEVMLDEEEFASILDEADYYSQQKKAFTKEADKAEKAYTDAIARVIAAMGQSTTAVCTDRVSGCVYKIKYAETAVSPAMNKDSILKLRNENISLYQQIEPYVSYRGGSRRFTMRKITKGGH